MATNVTKVDRLHDLMPAVFNTKTNPNWSGLIEAAGSQDQLIADLVEEVRKQFFVKTASRPYIDTLASNNLLSRPRLLGMDDPTFRKYIPILSYQPKQVRNIITSILDIFFAKESTSTYMTSSAAEPFVFEDGWELNYLVDGVYDEFIVFEASDFANIGAATAAEIASVINRKGRYSFAEAYLVQNPIKQTLVRIFSKTIGSRGSLLIKGGRSLIALQPNGFISDAGTNSNTSYTVTKIGDELTWEWTGGNTPSINFLKTGDIAIIDLVGNEGSFALESVDIANNKFVFRNLLGNTGIFTQTSSNDVKFLRPKNIALSDNPTRAAVWEVSPDEISVEFPATATVGRNIIGGAYINGVTSIMTTRISDTSLTLLDATNFTSSGTFKLQRVDEIKTRILTISENNVISVPINTRLQGVDEILYSYSGVTGNNLTGISPSLPVASSLHEYTLSSLTRNGTEATAVTSAINSYNVGEYVAISGASDPTFNGSWLISTIVNSTTFKFDTSLFLSSAIGATARVERFGLADSGSIVILNNSKLNTGIDGPHIYDTNSSFVLSSLTAPITTAIQAGKIVPILNIGTNSILNEPGFVIFDYGQLTQEGPVPYLYKPNSNSIALDPSYVFLFNHSINSTMVMLRYKGGVVLTADGAQIPAYVTDTSVARIALQKLMLDVKAAGIFINFLIKFPDQLYSVLDTYNSSASLG